MQKMRQDISIGNNLRLLRQNSGLTQEQVAARLQVAGSETARSVYSRYETGELNIKISDLVLLTKIFKCDFNAFFRDLIK